MPYFTTAELRALPDMGDTTRYTDARLTAAHDWIAGVIERECQTSFIATAVTEKLDGSGTDTLILSRPYVLSVTSAFVGGTALTADELSALVLRGGIVYRPTGYTWASGRANVDITYSAGYSSAPPADLKEAALIGARYHVLTTDGKSGASDRATSITNEFGNIQLSVASADGRPTGLPEVDATITAWSRITRVPGFA
jgi:hypothetical protein